MSDVELIARVKCDCCQEQIDLPFVGALPLGCRLPETWVHLRIARTGSKASEKLICGSCWSASDDWDLELRRWCVEAGQMAERAPT